VVHDVIDLKLQMEYYGIKPIESERKVIFMTSIFNSRYLLKGFQVKFMVLESRDKGALEKKKKSRYCPKR
jgi:hypothetical protein